MARISTRISGDFASGMAIPVRGDSDGGIALAEGDEFVKQQVFMAMLPGHSDNPFVNVGVSSAGIFGIAGDPAWRVRKEHAIRASFGILERENLARIVDIRWHAQRVEGETRMTLRYLNLESGTQADINAAVTDEDSGLRFI